MNDYSEYEVLAMKKEIDNWRRYFVEEITMGPFGFIPKEDKQKLLEYFLSIPFSSFSEPWREWNACLAHFLEKKKLRDGSNEESL